MDSADIVILGAGLAGLALASELTSADFAGHRIALVEPRMAFTRDRTWSYWRYRPHPFQHLERRRWDRWRVSDWGGQSRVIESAVPYCTLDADAFYAEAQRRFQAAPHVALHLGVGATRVEVDRGRPLVQLTDGRLLRPRLVFDSRPRPAPASYLQSFLGFELRADRACFTADCPDLMDFQPRPRGAHFFYVLPYSADTALVEATWIDHQPQHGEGEGALRGYLAQRWPGVRFRARYRESGCLPLVTTPPAGAGLPGVIDIGTRAGTGRAATGYAFTDTLHDAHRLARCLAAAGEVGRAAVQLRAFRRPRLDAWMDEVFLRAITRGDGRAAALFMALFMRCPAHRLTRFLAGEHGVADRFAVIRSLPVQPLLAQALASP